MKLLSVIVDCTVKLHKPNLCVSQQICTFCMQDKDLKFCVKCGLREYIYREEPKKNFLTLTLTPKKDFSKVICISHNGQSFDNQFLLKHMVEDMLLKPKLILNGSKIILITVEKMLNS